MKIPSEATEFYNLLQRMLVEKGYSSLQAITAVNEVGEYGDLTKDGFYQLCMATPGCAGDATTVPNISGPDWLHNMMAEFADEKKIAIKSVAGQAAGFTDQDRRTALGRQSEVSRVRQNTVANEEAVAKAKALLKAKKAQAKATGGAPTKPVVKRGGGEYTSTQLSKK